MDNAPRGHADVVIRSDSGFRSGWQSWSITALSAFTLLLLCQPWLSASGPYGNVRTDAFGRLDGSVPALRIYGEPVATISGWWGALIAAAAVVALIGAQVHRMIGAGRSVAIVAAMVNVVAVPVTLLYLNSKSPELKKMTEDHDDLKETLGNLVKSLFGSSTGQQPAAEAAQQAATAALTDQALLCCVVAALTAVLAICLRRRGAVGSDAYAHDESSESAETEGPAVQDIDDLTDQVFERMVQHNYALLQRLAADDEDEVHRQRLLQRDERLRRSDSVRQTRRRPLPRPAMSAAEKPQPTPWVAASRSGRLAGLSQPSAEPPFLHGLSER
ncbi:hypothetical protein FMUAM8_43960 [Nocardia cyriacigeorgica]|uniref:Uncharacterized protein n=1 Tax=Nocardia cyriacigeorgica (strain GUH-2) TaxID=1127134 RepID=H6RAI2_NOCCG|nr:hypothetical protein FMUAM8_43960 [Nocardia cyriacigeorgica]CCF64994.1 membrane protein of unknown function [Nocardia cyriacigeorgica GUH-2]